ncbi:lipid A biosynthesis acyltransferase [Flavobacterium sp. MFBS3-15]|uniref:lysophospholipid acyltransferase family protein n=1 Tax=Flavobacterium sp. MFBS3-15 TaxID=2989816 RepID=UPI0022360D2A|nr:lipid A biosynthesis acyltransferase [Flavobacterium sp. MFBS3-15]MCW4468539.1 lipid A biosynthesis acyltransferase [Flavobacterium sp. MFBS3-15]
MQFLAYALAYPILRFISILPFRALYFLSDCTYILLYRIIGYRKSTVRKNLALALPHLSDKERREVEKKSYKHFCDTFFEMAKSLSISDKQIRQRFQFTNMDLAHEYENKGKSVVLLVGHYGSYEWLLSMNLYFHTFKGIGIYKAIRNKYFNELVKRIRRRFGAELIGTKSIIPAMRKNAREGIKGFYGFISDQSPKSQSIIYYGKFFGVEVPMQVGGEILAKKLDMNVMFARVEKVSRGHYQCTFVPLDGSPKEYPNFTVTDWFMNLLEEQIIQKPEYYLWTHKRFKHRKKESDITA